MTQQFHSWMCIQKNENTNSKRYIHLSIQSSIVFNNPRHRSTQVPVNRWMDEDVICMCVYMYIMVMLSHVRLFANPRTVTRQAPLSMWTSRQEYWSGLPFIPPGSLPDTRFEPVSPALAGRFFTAEPPGNPYVFIYYSAIKRNEKFAICKNMDGLRGYYSKWN